METRCAKHRQLLLCVVSAAIAVAAPAAEVYRWTDAKGQVHYGQHAPHGEFARRLDLPTAEATPEPVDGAARRERRRRVLEDFDYRRQRKREDAARLRQQQLDKAAECENLQRQWRRLTHAGPIYYKGPDGERDYLDDSRREAEKDALRPLNRDACGESP